MVTGCRQWFTASWCQTTPVPLAVARPGCLNRRVRDREELVRRWQAGWSVSRGWTTVEEDNDGILIVRAGEESYSTEYVVLDADDKPERVERAAQLALADGGGRGSGWITLATDDKEARIEQLEELGLEVQQDQDWLMTIQLSEQPALKLHERYSLHTELEDDLIITRATMHGGVVSSGRMAVVGEDAVADRIETDPAHRSAWTRQRDHGIAGRDGGSEGCETRHPDRIDRRPAALPESGLEGDRRHRHRPFTVIATDV